MSKYLFEGPLTVDVIKDFLFAEDADSSAGGISAFLGKVRSDEVNGRIVQAIEYSAYNEMISAEACKIEQEIYASFNDVRTLSILHSTGIVKAGEYSLLVVATAGHRQQAIEACRVAVEKIKERLPVWKKEIYDDESYKWK